MFEIYIAMIMVVVSVAIVVWFQKHLADASARRMTRMMTRVGLDPAIAASAPPRGALLMKQMQRRCRRCPSADLCERWIAGVANGGNSFCPNARAFGIYARTAAAAG